MTAQIIDLSTARLLRDLEALHGRNEALIGLARHQTSACRQAERQLEDLKSGLHGFVRRLDEHRRRCEGASRRLRRSVEALESGDVERMIEARDDLAHHMARRRRR